jgi:transcription antitermination factor NusG
MFLGQENNISELENKKKEIINQINILNDSIKIIDLEINAIKSIEIQKMITNSTLKATVQKGAKLKKNPDVFSELIIVLLEDKEVTILDYFDGYFGVCTDSICGYMSGLWINQNNKINEFIRLKEDEKKELERLENEQKIKIQKAEWAELEKIYIKKYGQTTYSKLKQGYYWIGMTREMATISLGSTNDINRTVGSWGVHEQWVYDNLYLYFENGILTSYQN